MSTTAIEDALEMAFAYAVDGTDAEPRQRARVAAARAELEAIRKAAKLYTQGWETADAARALLTAIAKEE